jgi:hypothetical protein
MPGKWVPLRNQPPFAAGLMLLLTDGTVFVQDSGSVNRFDLANWWRLIPDASGSYSNGTWQPRHWMDYAPQGYASAVLADGRVIVAGGENVDYSYGIDVREVRIYDPVNDSAGWDQPPWPPYWQAIGDAPSAVLPDGRFMIGSIADSKIAVFDPGTGTWKDVSAKGYVSSTEESWVLLRDGSVLTVDCYQAPNTAERYLPVQDRWVPAGSPVQNLVDPSTSEIGPALLLPDGRAFFIGSTGRTGLYTPPARLRPQSWAQGPDIPLVKAQHIDGGDAPAVLMPNGQVLFAGSPMGGTPAVTYFFEFNPAANTIEPARPPPNADTHASYQSYLLLLPTGEVLHSDWSTTMALYTPEQTQPQNSWRPTTTSCPSLLVRGMTATLKGRQLNGLSQANCFGDDGMSATNYPLVRLTYSSGEVVYLRTHDHSSMGVATGTRIVSTRFDVKKDGVADDVPLGNAALEVIANGIASAPMNVVVMRSLRPPVGPPRQLRKATRMKRKVKKAKRRAKARR